MLEHRSVKHRTMKKKEEKSFDEQGDDDKDIMQNDPGHKFFLEDLVVNHLIPPRFFQEILEFLSS